MHASKWDQQQFAVLAGQDQLDLDAASESCYCRVHRSGSIAQVQTVAAQQLVAQSGGLSRHSHAGGAYLERKGLIARREGVVREVWNGTGVKGRSSGGVRGVGEFG